MNDKTISKFIERLSKIGINVELFGNYPWVYLNKINGKRVTELQESDHGFVIFIVPFKKGINTYMVNPKNTFKTIRKYL